jgi:hypothetical protein
MSKETIAFNSENSTKTDFAVELQNRLILASKDAQGEKKIRTVWDGINREYIQDISCIVTDIVFETLSYYTFGNNIEYYEKMLDGMVKSIINRGSISEELEVSLFEELVKSGVNSGLVYVEYKIENIEKHKEYVNNMIHLGRHQIAPLRSLLLVISGQLYDIADKRSKGIFPSKNLRNNLEDGMLEDAMATARVVISEEHILEDLFFSLSPKRIEHSLGDDLVLSANDLKNILQMVTKNIKSHLYTRFDTQVRDFNHKADKYFEQLETNISRKYKLALLVIVIAGGIGLTGMGGLVASFITGLGQNYILPIGGALIASGVFIALGDGAFSAKTFIESYFNNKVKLEHREFSKTRSNITKPDNNESIILDANIISSLNPVSKKKETEEVCMKFTEKYCQINKKKETKYLTKQEQYQVVDLMFKNSL